MRRMLFLTGILCLAASMAVAQDVMKVAGGPETHKVLLENSHVRVFDVLLKPGQKIAMHSHPANIVYCVSDAKFKFTYPDGKTQARECKAGTALWREGETHAAENAGTAEIHLVQIEMKGAGKKAEPAKKKAM